MKQRLVFTFVLVAALSVALPMFAQRGVSPSITNGTYMGYPAASPVLTPNNQVLGDSAPRVRSFGVAGTGVFAGHPVGNKSFILQRHHHLGNDCLNCFSFPGYFYPGYLPPYYYDPYGYGYAPPVVMEDNSSLPGAGTFNSAAPPYQQMYSPNAGTNSVIDEEQGGSFYARPEVPPVAPVVPPQSQGVVTTNGGEESDVRTLLIFKDGHQLEVTNYAIMGSTVYVFTGDRRKIPLSDIDLDATIKANEQRGVDFHVPAAADHS